MVREMEVRFNKLKKRKLILNGHVHQGFGFKKRL
jgi:hypothetical protein